MKPPPKPASPPILDRDPASYGSKGQAWNAAFVQYMVEIVLHPNYAGMPDAVKADGKIQWEAPSNRGGGLYKDTHHKRRDWWRAKAAALGISDHTDRWISRAAKKIHPTGEKPCKRCGRILRIAYVYPSGTLTRRGTKAFGEELAPDSFEEIGAYIRRVVATQGTSALRQLPKLLRTGTIEPPSLGEDLEGWLAWLARTYIPLEPSPLSPGVMSNAPDRFDGFHSFNRCCRSEADTGRHDSNMRTYTTDRRVFEFWSEGNWIAADRMMGLVRERFGGHANADGGVGPPTADHIGPLSLGFCHRPEFRLLSKAANSAKNNRITVWDVRYLCGREAEGEAVVSWYAKPIWDRLKARVTDEETALRLSKVMRDNQRIAMDLLAHFLERGHAAFLAALLALEHADQEVSFSDPAIVDFVTSFGALVCADRTTKYASEQKARRTRIGFEALRLYASKGSRHFQRLTDDRIARAIREAEAALDSSPDAVRAWDAELIGVLNTPGSAVFEEGLRVLCGQLPTLGAIPTFLVARRHLEAAMGYVAEILAARWDDERYVRAEFAFDDD